MILAESIMNNLPKETSAISYAKEVSDRASEVGFDWLDISKVWEKIFEEITELEDAITHSPKDIEEELGDVLFSIVNLARHLRLDPELALSKSNKKFIARFTAIERNLAEKNKLISDCAEIELEELWGAQK
jgi:uncharacterized protein YabN with tetrapyrrole methylase and pyrophosphatase domain